MSTDVQLAQARAVQDIEMVLSSLRAAIDGNLDLLGYVVDGQTTLARAENRLRWVNSQVHDEIVGRKA